MDQEVYESLAGPAIRFSPPSTPSKSPAKDGSFHLRRSPSKRPRIPAFDPYPEYTAIVNNQSVAASEKELATRVLNAAQKIRQWCEEIERWRWTGSFDLPIQDGMESAAEADLGKDRMEPHEKQEATEYWGCLPSSVVQEYENRLDIINQELADLDMDDLKERILDIHQTNSRPSSSYSSITISNLNFLDDFSLFVTENLIQTLPSYAALRRHLRTWTVRVWVLREVPLFLQQLLNGQTSLRQAKGELIKDEEFAFDKDFIESEQIRIDQLRMSLEDQIAGAGQRLDAMLDNLEGYDDVLPDHWVDDFEAMESGLTAWVVDAQSRIFQLRMALHSPPIHDPIAPDLLKDIPSAEPDLIVYKLVAASDQIEVAPRTDIQTTELVTSPEPISSPKSAELTVPSDSALESPQVQNHSLSNSSPTHADLPSVSTKQSPASKEIHDTLLITEISPNADKPAVSLTQEPRHQDTESSEGLQARALGTDEEHPTPTINIETSYHDSFPKDTASESSSPIKSTLDGLPVATSNHDISLLEEHDSEQSNRNSSSTLDDSHMSLDNVFSDVPSPTESAFHNQSFTEPSSPVEPTDTRTPEPPETPLVQAHKAYIQNDSPSSSPFPESDLVAYDEMEDSPSQRKRPMAKAPKPPLNSMMKKRTQRSSLTPIETSPKGSKLQVTHPEGLKSPSNSLSPCSPVMPLQDQISNILEAIPTPIRLKAGAGPNAPDVKRLRHRTPSSNQPRRTPTPSFGQPTITLAPADDGGPRRSGVNDPEIKLYHLIQSGKEKPIKLFIRRVGENGERVMVRVGGGWADLGEYLRIYAEHHGRRAVSDGRVELQAIAVDSAGNATPKSTESRRTSLIGGRSVTPSVETPNSTHGTPQASIETPQSAVSTASRRSSNWDEVGLAGPFTKRAEMSGEKKDWVEGIVEQAKLSLSKSGKKVEVGDLGKAGTTRRVFFRGGTPGPE